MSKPILQPYDWVGSDIDNYYAIRIWCHDRESQRVAVHVNDWKPMCKIQLPTVYEGKACTWSPPAVNVYISWLRNALGEHGPVEAHYTECSNLYYYNKDRKFPYLICAFDSQEALKHCTNFLAKQSHNIRYLGNIKTRVAETNVNLIHKFITQTGLGYSQWFSVNKNDVVDELDKITNNKLEYRCSWKDLVAISPDISKEWIVSPTLASIDIETYSSNHKAMPTREYASDVVSQISYITKKLCQEDSIKKYLLVLGDCDDIPGVTVMRYEYELSLIDGLCQLIIETNPSLLIGYNIFKYDFPYLSVRKALCHSDWINCGLLKNGRTYIDDKKWFSKAYGDIIVSNLVAEGRICIDLYPIIKRDYNRLDKYTLDHVSRYFLDKGKHDVTPLEMFRTFALPADDSRRNSEMARVGSYCIQDSYLCVELMEKLNIWLMLVEMSNIVCVRMVEVFSNGQQMRVQNQLYINCFQSKIVMDERSGGSGFKGAHVVDPIPGFYRNIIILDFQSLYPSIIIRYNICFTTYVPPERKDIPDEMCNVIECKEANETFVHRFIKREIQKGLLPAMCENLISRRNETKKQMRGLEEDSLLYVILDKRQNALKVCANSIFGALGVAEGRIPLPEGARCITAIGRILQGKAAQYVIDKYQGRIVYGDTDSIMVDLNLKDPRECNKFGEKLSEEISALYEAPLRILFERAYVLSTYIKKKKYAGVGLGVVNNPKTVEECQFDSKYKIDGMVLYKFGVTNKKGAIEYRYLAIPQEYVPDKSEKMFAGVPVLEGGRPNPKEVMKKGILNARRDNCLWARNAYSKVLIDILFGRTEAVIKDTIDEEVMKLVHYSVPLSHFTMTRELKSNYAVNSHYPFKIFADELRKQLFEIVTGDRIEYVFVRKDNEEKGINQGKKMRLPETYRSNVTTEPLDIPFYIRSLNKPITQLLEINFPTLSSGKPVGRGRMKKYNVNFSKNYLESWAMSIWFKDAVIRDMKQLAQ